MTATEETPAPEKTTHRVTVDGVTFEAQPGELIIKAAQEHGIYIPRFCWHERMKPVGMCRMCLVQVDGVRGFPPACTTPVADGMVVHSQNEAVKKIQDGVLEFLLINHPLDCPVCDRGGECPLQDQTLAFGPGESRFVEEKRHFTKPIPLSELVLLDRERCIQCARCTRFADEIAGDALIDFVDRGDRTQVLNFEEHPFDSYFSGNTVQICPVGALTASQYRFRARPWDLATVETSCTTCSVQCRGALQSSSNRLVRLLGVDSEPVNHGWLCDKGRYGIEWVHSGARILEPQMVEGGARQEVSWPAALGRAAEHLSRAKELHGAASIAVIGGARGTNEDAYLWSVLAKGVLRTDNVDAQIGDGLPGDVVLGMPRAEIGDLERASAIVVLDHDLRDAVPVAFLRLRRAVIECKVPLVDLAPVEHALSDRAAVVARTIPGEPIASTVLDEVARVREGRSGPVVVIAGRSNLGATSAGVVAALAECARIPDVRMLSALRRANVHGALDAGLTPGFLPGRVTLAAGNEWFTKHWGGVPNQAGLDTEGVLRAAVEGKVRVLVLVGADPIADFPDATLAREALTAVDTIIAVDAFPTESNATADVFLPCTLWGEKTGTVSNLEGRVQRVQRKVAPEGTAMDDWRIAVELAFRLGRDLDLATVDEVTDEIARVAPAFAGVNAALLARARDGAVLPLSEHAAELIWRSRDLHLLADDGQGTSWDPLKVEGETPAEDDAATATVPDTTAMPALHTWNAAAVSKPEAPPRDAYALRLVVGRMLYDGGRIARETPILHRVASTTALRVHPSDLARVGVESGGQVKITSARGSQVVEVAADPGVPAGVASFDFTADSLGPSLLIDAGQPVTELRAGDRAMNILALDPLFDQSFDFTIFAVVVIKVVIAFVLLLISVMLYIWALRKVIADMQNRIGPNRAGPYGVLQTLADGIKLFFKEQSIPDSADRPVFRLAPYLAILPAFMLFCIIPLGGTVSILGRQTYLQVVDIPVGALFILAMSGVGIYGVMLAGWSSGSKYPLLGSVRASAQLLSYEAAFGLAILAVLIQANTFSTHDIVFAHQYGTSWLTFFSDAYWPRTFVAFVIFLIAATAEVNHPPFDLVEAEQELVGGFNTEYTGIRFAIFFLAEFMNVITMSAIAVFLFLGGPSGPLIGPLATDSFVNTWVMPLFWFMVKLLALLFATVWLRASVPRMRYDKLMALGWKYLIEIAILWVLVTAALQVGKDQGWNLGLTAVVSLALAVGAYGVLYAAMPKKGEHVEELR